MIIHNSVFQILANALPWGRATPPSPHVPKEDVSARVAQAATVLTTPAALAVPPIEKEAEQKAIAKSPEPVAPIARKGLTLEQQRSLVAELVKRCDIKDEYPIPTSNMTLRQFIQLNLLKYYIAISWLNKPNFSELADRDFFQAIFGSESFWTDPSKFNVFVEQLSKDFILPTGPASPNLVTKLLWVGLPSKIAPLLKYKDLFDLPISQTSQKLNEETFGQFCDYLGVVFYFFDISFNHNTTTWSQHRALKFGSNLIFRKFFENQKMFEVYFEKHLKKIKNGIEMVAISEPKCFATSLFLKQLEKFTNGSNIIFAQLKTYQAGLEGELKKYSSKLTKEKDAIREFVEKTFLDWRNLIALELIGKIILPIMQSAYKNMDISNEVLLDIIDLDDPDFGIVNKEALAPSKPAPKDKKHVKGKQKAKQGNKKPKKISTPVDPSKGKEAPTAGLVSKENPVSNFSQHLEGIYYQSEAFFKGCTLDKKVLALQNQLHANHAASWVRDLLDLDGLTGPQKETLSATALYWTYLAGEQALSASHIHKDPNKILIHRLSYFAQEMKVNADNPWLRDRSLDRFTITYRYGAAWGIKRPGFGHVSDLDKRISACMTLQMNLFAGDLDIEKTQRSALEGDIKEFNAQKSPASKPAKWEAAKQGEGLLTMAKEGVYFIEALEKRIKELAAGEKETRQANILRDLCFHLKNLTHVISLLPNVCMEPKFAYVCAHMASLSAQYVIENLGQYLAQLKGETLETLWRLNIDVHDLNVYCERYQLNQSLDRAQNDLLQALNLGNKGAYLASYFARTPFQEQSPVMISIRQLYENAKGAGVMDAEKLFPMCQQWTGLAFRLVASHALRL